ncbi:39S ribosomal protein L41, mitochondrial [Ischnura elegans]|uniref:39S ribosomal protein L41, mitochondrial n=1 Tax=Ischnura elegans TaxID=197161 RepID=UPI001ED8BD64|nr:39S ribosomal protein L41, mitochondrial [Ischnura elegans]
MDFANSLARYMVRGISTSAPRQGKRNFRKFLLYNKRGTRQYKKEQSESTTGPVFTRGVREIGYHDGQLFKVVPEMIPELIVPNLSDCKLKPYVSYRAPDVYQTEFTAKDLFDAVYGSKIADDFKHGKLDSQGNPITPSPEELLTPEEAVARARKTGSDIF